MKLKITNHSMTISGRGFNRPNYSIKDWTDGEAFAS